MVEVLNTCIDLFIRQPHRSDVCGNIFLKCKICEGEMFEMNANCIFPSSTTSIIALFSNYSHTYQRVYTVFSRGILDMYGSIQY